MKIKSLMAACVILSTQAFAQDVTVTNGYGPATLYGGFSIKGDELVTTAVYACNAGLFKVYADTTNTPMKLTVVKTGDGIDCMMVPFPQQLKLKLPKIIDKETGNLVVADKFVLTNTFKKSF
ncbi:hypothetical protein KCM76_11905 [Zooshikella marina]|uniref:Uncharacterized protein n=1 Tax=Zooshikella ganghwensis TaxID=202772 RepID=A0A4P9VNI1_9GAMM|nr:hypothetical protein [Zooshikella ganghwensis]MBU2706687.1 hypothetical protein [Zooshikella ganghwensis]RDH43954.1 hypothetical protein B9G39_11135 [Zooshikella ganghwensis]